MAIDLGARSGSEVGNFNFAVKILGLTDELTLGVPADRVEGLNDGNTTIIRQRINGVSDNIMEPFPSLTTPENVTISGCNVYNLADLKKLQEWRDQCKGRSITGLGGYLRDIIIAPGIYDDEGLDIAIQTGETPGFFKLINCVAVRLSISSFDANSPAVSEWSLEVAYADMKVL